MNRNIIGVILILAGIAAAVFNWAYKPAVAPDPAPQPAIQTAPKPASAPKQSSVPKSASTPPAAPAFTSNIQVAIRGFEYVSESVKVKAGTKITWTNFDTAGHTVTSDSGLFGSKILSQGKSFEYVFNTPGTYTYHCAPHPYMKGEIVVE